MRKILLIIKREYLTRVKTKGFIIGTVIVPLIGLGTILLVVFMVGHSSTHELAPRHRGRFRLARAGDRPAASTANSPTAARNSTSRGPSLTCSSRRRSEDLRGRINAEQLDAYLGFRRTPTRSFELHMRNPDNFSLIGPLSNAVDQAVISSRLGQRGVHVDDIKAILKSTDLQLLKVSETGESVEKGQGIAIAVALVAADISCIPRCSLRSVPPARTNRTPSNCNG